MRVNSNKSRQDYRRMDVRVSRGLDIFIHCTSPANRRRGILARTQWQSTGRRRIDKTPGINPSLLFAESSEDSRAVYASDLMSLILLRIYFKSAHIDFNYRHIPHLQLSKLHTENNMEHLFFYVIPFLYIFVLQNTVILADAICSFL